MFGCTDNQEVGLEAAILERVRNSSLVKCSSAENVTGLKLVAEAAGVRPSGRTREESVLRPAKRRGDPAVEASEVRMPA